MANLLYTSAKQKTHPGRKRPNNEDFVDLYEPNDQEELLSSGCLYVVADGVGGAAYGEQASKYAVQEVLFEYYKPSPLTPQQRLEQALLAANYDIYTYSRSDRVDTQMATTLVAALIIQNQLIIANVGDSPAYLIRNGQIQELSQDHSARGELIRNGTLTEEEARNSKIKNQLMRSLGGDEDVIVYVSAPVNLLPGDRIVLCTDGVTRYANRQQIAQMAGTGAPEEAVNRLVDYANHQGGADNITALVVLVEPQEAIDQTLPIRPARRLGAVRIEDMETVTPGVPPRRRNGSVAAPPPGRMKQVVRRLDNRTVQFWILAGGIVIVLLTFGGIWAASSQPKEKTPEATLSVEAGIDPTDPIFTFTPGNLPDLEGTIIPPYPMGEITPTTIEPSTSQAPTNQEGIPTETLTKDAPQVNEEIPTDTPQPTITPTKIQGVLCLVQVKSGNIDPSVANVFSIGYKFEVSDYKLIVKKYTSGCNSGDDANYVTACSAGKTTHSPGITLKLASIS